jgi:hypothetical protein
MKTKCIFEPSDFEGSGQMVVRNSSPPGSADIAFLASVAYKIGWITQSGPNKIARVSLTDGMIITYESEIALCAMLNDDPCGFRPMTQKEIHAVTSYVGNRFYK